MPDVPPVMTTTGVVLREVVDILALTLPAVMPESMKRWAMK